MPDKAGSPRILLIDDDPLQNVYIQGLVREFRTGHYEVEWASCYHEGLQALTNRRFAACFLDYRLGSRNGIELLKACTRMGCKTPVIMLTSLDDGNVDLAALNAGAADYLVKTEISARSLERALRNAMRTHENMTLLQSLATHDPLTGLLNRRELDRILAEECSRSGRFRRPLSLLIFDLDHFKRINDTHGHQAGDAVLQQIASLLAGQVRGLDRVARFGGEEFVVIEIETDLPGALLSANRLREAIAQDPCLLPDGTALTVTASVGVACFPEHGTEPPALLRNADRALYEAKARGRNLAVAAGEHSPV